MTVFSRLLRMLGASAFLLAGIGLSSIATAQQKADFKAAEALMKDVLAGGWRVTIRDQDGGKTLGQATISREDGTISLVLFTEEGEKKYRQLEALSPKITDPKSLYKLSLIARVERQDATEPVAFASDSAEAEPITVPKEWDTLTIRHDGEGKGTEKRSRSINLPIVWATEDRERLRFDLRARESAERLSGTWRREGEEKVGGSTLWVRGEPAIEGVLVVEDQGAPEARYPFDHDGKPLEGAQQERTLIVVGSYLPPDSAFAAAESREEGLDYVFTAGTEPVSDEQKTALEKQLAAQIEAARRAADISEGVKKLDKKLALLKDGEIKILKAVLMPGVAPGFRELSIAGSTATWPLLFADQEATLKLVRPADQYGADPVTTFYTEDSLAVELEVKAPIPYKDITLELMKKPVDAGADDKAEAIGYVNATLADFADYELVSTYRTEEIRISSSAGGDPNSISLSLAPGDVIAARLVDPGQALTRPQVALAAIRQDPSELGELWAGALEKVAACDGDEFDGSELYALKTSKSISRIVVGELLMRTASYVSPLAKAAVAVAGSDGRIDVNPSVNVLKGDHAAAILIKDELINVLSSVDVVQRLAALVNNRQGEIRALRQAARESGDPAAFPLLANYSGTWKVTLKSHPGSRLFSFVAPGLADTVEIPLVDTLDTDKLASELGVTRIEAEAWAERETLKAAKAQTVALEAAIGRAAVAGDCDIEELLVVAGQKSDAAVARILPRLVKKEARPGAPGATYWVTDKLAQGFVKRLYVVGDGARALNEYAKIDDSYKAMAVAAATAGIGTALSAGGYGAAATYAMLAADAVDMGYFGLKGVQNYIEAEDYYNYARGGGSVFGSDAVAEAEAMRESGAMAAVGLIAPGVSSLSNLKHLKNLRNVQKGKALLAAKGAEAVVDDFDDLSYLEKADLTAYYMDIQRRAAARGPSKISPEDRAAFDALRNAPYKGLDELLGPEFANALETPGTLIRYEGQPLAPRTIERLEPALLDSNTRGSFNTVSPVPDSDGTQLFRYPVGQGGKAKPAAVLADRGGRNAFQSVMDGDNVRLAKLHREIELAEGMTVGDGRYYDKVRLEKGDIIEVVENVPGGDFASALAREKRTKMTEFEAIAFDMANRDMNRKGLVWLDNKTNNYAFAPHPNPQFEGQLQVVILDPGGIVPVRGLDADVAANIQRHVNAPPASFAEGYARLREDWRYRVKADIIRDEFGSQLDYEAIGQTGVDGIEFLPTSVEAFPRARDLSSLSDAEAATAYQRLLAVSAEAGR